MSSIMTNASAMTALKSLQATNKSLESTQARISTGFRVAQASDNAAYWSIATTMRSDNKAMGTVQDALGLGAAQVDVAYTAMEATKDVLDNIKTKLVAASQPGVDKGKIQSEITQLRSQLEGIASAASFSGTNWLSVNSDASDYNATQQVVSSFTRSSDGAVSIATIDIDISKTALFDTGADTGAAATLEGVGLLDKGVGNLLAGGIKDAAALGTGGAVPAAAVATMDNFASLTLDADDTISFDIAIDGGETKTVTIDAADAAATATPGTIATAAEMATILTAAFTAAGVTGVTVDGTGAALTFTSGTTGVASSVTISNTEASNGGNAFGINDVDITSATAEEISAYISGVDKMAAAVTTAASDLGAVKSRISMQKDFVSNLMNAVERGVGALVDANMNQESTRLQALQVQQQLGIQALSIANGNAQSILALFK